MKVALLSLLASVGTCTAQVFPVNLDHTGSGAPLQGLQGDITLDLNALTVGMSGVVTVVGGEATTVVRDGNAELTISYTWPSGSFSVTMPSTPLEIAGAGLYVAHPAAFPGVWLVDYVYSARENGSPVLFGFGTHAVITRIPSLYVDTANFPASVNVYAGPGWRLAGGDFPLVDYRTPGGAHLVGPYAELLPVPEPALTALAAGGMSALVPVLRRSVRQRRAKVA